MSQSPNRPDEGASGPAEYADWRKQVEDVQRILSSKASILLASLKPGNRQSVEAAIKEGPVLFAQLQEMEKLQQSRLDDLDRRHDEWQGAVSHRTNELTKLEQAVRQQQNDLSLLGQDADRQQDEMTKVGRELGSFANQRVDAMEKVATLEETSRRHEQSVREEDTRLKARSAALDARQQELDLRQAVLTSDVQVLDERQRDLANEEEENRKKSAKIGKRLDVLAEYKDLKSQEVTRLKSQVEALQAENGGFTEARRVLEERTTSSEQDAAAAKAHVVDLQGTIQSQNTELSTLHTVQAEKIRVTKGFMHIASVILPQKEAEITSSKTELAKVKRDTSALNEEMTGRITELDAERSRLQDQFQEQGSRLSQLENDHALLQAAADESSSEADSAKKKLVVAEATTESLNSEVARLQQRHLQLLEEIDRLRRCKVDFDAAIRLQNLSNDKIKDLEEERNNIRQERDNLRRERDNLRQERDSIRHERDGSRRHRDSILQERDSIRQECDGNRQQLNTLSIQHKRLGEEAKKNADLQNQAMRKEAETSELLRRRCEASERLYNETNEENLDLTLQRDELTREKRTLTDQCHDLTEDVHALTGEYKDLERLNADLKQDKRDMSRNLEETQDELERLTQQLQQCHCSNRRSSRKRHHDQMVSDEEESSSADEADGNTRRKGKEPESKANLDAPGRSDRVDASRTSVSPELPASETEGSKTNNAGQLMNTNAPRALGSANPTITPSDGAAFSISVKDATLLNFSSDVLPIEVLQVLRRKFRVWIANTSFKWATVQSSATNRNCIEARLERKKSEWNDGSGYACAVCARRGRLCVVVTGGDQVLLLPRKAAEETGEGAMDAVYWTR